MPINIDLEGSIHRAANNQYLTITSQQLIDVLKTFFQDPKSDILNVTRKKFIPLLLTNPVTITIQSFFKYLTILQENKTISIALRDKITLPVHIATLLNHTPILPKKPN